MEAKWPFFLITFVLLFGLGYILSTLERSGVMEHWTERRCEIPVMIAAQFFKPETDPRTPGDFASDNFSFCMESYIEKFMALFMSPINVLFGKQLGITNSMADLMSSIRKMMSNMYNAFSAYLGSYFQKFQSSVFQLSRVIQHLRMAVGRMSAVAISMIYAGISAFRSMINSIQVVVRVILIICSIMLAIIIILFFVLFPVIPMILSTLTAVVTIVIALGSVMSSSIAGEAEGKKSGFCLEAGSRIPVVGSDGRVVVKNVEDIRLGDTLSHGCGKVTAVLQMTSDQVDMYDLNGIRVSGSHLVYHEKEWKSVAEHPDAKPTYSETKPLYCFNTIHHRIPVISPNNLSVIYFRDWEEIDDDDYEAKMDWTVIVHHMLNPVDAPITTVTPCQTPFFSPYTQIYTPDGIVPLANIELGDMVLDETGAPTKVLGVVDGLVNGRPETKEWNTAIYEKLNSYWIRRISTVPHVNSGWHMKGYNLITETGTFIYYDTSIHQTRCVRDFTEVGHREIEQTYSYIAERLKMVSSPGPDVHTDNLSRNQ